MAAAKWTIEKKEAGGGGGVNSVAVLEHGSFFDLIGSNQNTF